MALELLAAVAAFAGVFLVVVGYFQAKRGQTQAQRRLATLASYSAGGAERSVPDVLRQQGSAWVERTRAQLERAGLALKIHEYVALRVLFGLAGFLVILLIGNATTFALLAGIVAGVVGYMLPVIYVRTRISRQVRRFNGQLEEMLGMISSSLRAGFGLLQALDLAADQLQPPMSTELHRLLRDTRMGATLEEALAKLSDRVGSYDLDVVITAILVQRSVGSNLSEVLDKVAHTIRERVRIKGEINTLTAQKRLSGWIVGLMPVAFVGLMLVLNFDYMSALFTDPTGRILLAIAVALDVLGILAIKRIVTVDV
jgi:tight adherence protein B